jgi:hypothetical protein
MVIKRMRWKSKQKINQKATKIFDWRIKLKRKINLIKENKSNEWGPSQKKKYTRTWIEEWNW